MSEMEEEEPDGEEGEGKTDEEDLETDENENNVHQDALSSETEEEEEDPGVMKDLSYYVDKIAKTMDNKKDETAEGTRFSDSESDIDLPDQPEDGDILLPAHMRSLQNTVKKSSSYHESNLGLFKTVCSASHKHLVDISCVQEFRNLRCVNFGKNYLRDFSALGELPYLATVKLYNNGIRNLASFKIPSLRFLDISHNKLKTVDDSYFPKVSRLKANYNRIRTFDVLKGHDIKWLRKLEFRGNGLKTTAGIHHPLLEELYLGENDIREIEGLENCPNLRRLHLRDNQILEVTGFSPKSAKLEYVNLRNNLVTFIDEAIGVSVLPRIQTLVMLDNPVQLEQDYRMVMICRMPSLKILDKEEIKPYDRDWSIITLLDCLYHEEIDLKAAVSDLFGNLTPVERADMDIAPPEKLRKNEAVTDIPKDEKEGEEVETAIVELETYWSADGGEETDDDLKREYWGEGKQGENETEEEEE